MRMAQVGVLLDREAAEKRRRYGINVFEAFVGEVLAHAGIPFEWIDSAEELARRKPDLLLAACAEEDQASAERLWTYAEQGGTVISYGGLNVLAAKLGCLRQPDIPVGYADSGADSGPLRFLGATPWERLETNAYPAAEFGAIRRERPTGDRAGAALQRFVIGKGSVERWSVDIPQTIVRFQQGIGPVLDDGIPAKDGTGAVDEGILKADDRIGMDWELDRSRTETGAPYFAFPYADLWKERLIGHLLACVTAKGMTLPFLGCWPEGVNAVATVSHDSDLNIDESAESTLAVLKECGINTSWCMIEPGFSPSIYELVKKAGHELAFHYNALDAQGGKWSEAEFARQLEWMKKATGKTRVASNKNHYTRFEGWGEQFEWCERHGIQADQTRGPSKKGNIGFLFGTCHPYFPIAWFDEDNRMYDVLEISFLTQDLDHHSLADSSVIVPFLEGVARVGGVAHFLFHQVHIHQQPPVANALRKLVAEAGKRGFEFWTSEQINDWERARRKVRIKGFGSNGELVAEGIESAANAVVYIPLPEGAEEAAAAEMRYGVPCIRKALGRASQQAVKEG
ncbi:hypothetical protein [Cohnella zeiphila]|uniref:NodB homology domain-containing protein n=1 Tax=Cohnella zeiphila TaxID=2761120 RepID=A0A7X0SQP1_9BACL|nr:hypothetical protein [Cohnella zeiphila]MBB6734311.1 hypothetical protein [Cohnella zeiphila]